MTHPPTTSLRITHKDPISDVMAKLKTIYPNAVHLTYVERTSNTQIAYSGLEHKTLSVREHFTRFFESVTPDELTEDHQKCWMR